MVQAMQVVHAKTELAFQLGCAGIFIKAAPPHQTGKKLDYTSVELKTWVQGRN